MVMLCYARRCIAPSQPIVAEGSMRWVVIGLGVARPILCNHKTCRVVRSAPGLLILGGLCLPFAVILNSNEDPSMNCTRWVLSREVLPVTYEECGLVGVRRVLKFGLGGIPGRRLCCWPVRRLGPYGFNRSHATPMP